MRFVGLADIVDSFACSHWASCSGKGHWWIRRLLLVWLEFGGWVGVGWLTGLRRFGRVAGGGWIGSLLLEWSWVVLVIFRWLRIHKAMTMVRFGFAGWVVACGARSLSDLGGFGFLDLAVGVRQVGPTTMEG